MNPGMSAPVSVVIPTYNGANFLREAISSVLAQTIRPAEIIVSDDCSRDDTLSIAAEFAANSSVPIVLLPARRNSGGPGRPLNAGIRAATGEFIAILEQDDCMAPARIERQISALNEFPQAGLSFGRYELLDQLKDIPHYHPDQQFAEIAAFVPENTSQCFLVPSHHATLALCKYNFTISNSNFCFRKSHWLAIGGFSESIRMFTDLEFALRSAASSSFAVVNQVILRYRYRLDSLNRGDRVLGRSEIYRVLGPTVLPRPDAFGYDYWQKVYWWYRNSVSSAILRGDLFQAWNALTCLVRTGAIQYYFRRARCRHKQADA
jgi:glycosyltransferase involved in cell wall biosynthesis